jgi:multiple antibiotic resistance protein
MADIWVSFLTFFAGFFAIMNPIANTPIFIGLTAEADQDTKKRVAKTATITAFIIVAIFTIAGKYIFELFGLTVPAFKITGGILIFFVGFEMLRSKKSSVNDSKNVNFDEGISISPLAIPILAGPGTIVTALNFVTKTSLINIALVLFVFLIIDLLTYVAFIYSDYVVKIIGENKIAVLGKLMGLIIGVLGTNMVLQGLKLAFP